MTWLLPGQSVNMPVLARAGRHHPYLVHQPRRLGRRAQRPEPAHLLGRPEGARRGGAAGRFLRRRAGEAGRGRERARPGLADRVADLLLADAVPQVGPDRRDQRQSRPLDRPVLAGGLGAGRSACRETPYFYARYRQEYPAVVGRDYLIADLEGRGCYVGTVMSVTLAQDGWFGEGRRLLLHRRRAGPQPARDRQRGLLQRRLGISPRTGHWFGQPRWQGDAAGDSGVCYRWHLPDPVHFTSRSRSPSSTRATATRIRGRLLPGAARFLHQRGLLVSDRPAQARLASCRPGPSAASPGSSTTLCERFAMPRPPATPRSGCDTTGFFGARPVLGWPNRSPEAVLTLPFRVAEEGRYAVRLTAADGPGNGSFDVLD